MFFFLPLDTHTHIHMNVWNTGAVSLIFYLKRFLIVCISGCVLKLLLGAGHEIDHQRSSLQVQYAFHRSVRPSYNIKFKVSPSPTYNFSLFLINKVHFPSWVRRSRRSMPTKSRRRRRRKRRPESNTRSPKRLSRGSWRTTKRWRPPPDTSKSYFDMAINVFCLVLLHWFVVLWVVDVMWCDRFSERTSVALAHHRAVTALPASAALTCCNSSRWCCQFGLHNNKLLQGQFCWGQSASVVNLQPSCAFSCSLPLQWISNLHTYWMCTNTI